VNYYFRHFNYQQLIVVDCIRWPCCYLCPADV